MLKGWLVLWAVVLAVLGVGHLVGFDAGLPDFLAGFTLVVSGVILAGTVGRGATAGAAMLGGLGLALALMFGLAALQFPSPWAASAVLWLGLMGGLQLALGRVPLSVLAVNLLVYGGLVIERQVGVPTSLVLLPLGGLLVVPSLLQGWLRRRRGEAFPADLARAEKGLRMFLALCLLVAVAGSALESSNPGNWVAAGLIGCWLISTLR